jgi:hypothetical protein
MVLALVILAVQAGFSRWWLSRFRYGPLEWGLRCATWWSVVPLAAGVRNTRPDGQDAATSTAHTHRATDPIRT